MQLLPVKMALAMVVQIERQLELGQAASAVVLPSYRAVLFGTCIWHMAYDSSITHVVRVSRDAESRFGLSVYTHDVKFIATWSALVRLRETYTCKLL